MDDLIKRLRRPVGAGMTGESALAMNEAAAALAEAQAEIERLLEENAKLRRLWQASPPAIRQVTNLTNGPDPEGWNICIGPHGISHISFVEGANAWIYPSPEVGLRQWAKAHYREALNTPETGG